MSKNNKNVESVVIELPPMPEQLLVVDVAGEAMLQNRMTGEAIEVIKGLRKGTDRKDYTQKSKQWRATGHHTSDGKLGHPAEAFQKAMASVIKGVDLSQKKLFKWPKDLHRAMHIESDGFDQNGNGIVVFSSGAPEMSEHVAVLQGKTPIPVYRTLIRNWGCSLRIVFNSALLTPHDIILLANRAGLSVGVGAFRAENRGPYGSFAVVGARMITKKAA